MTSHLFVQAAGWALLHFIRQGALIAFALFIALRCLRARSADARYFAACAALLFMLAAPVSTLYRFMSDSNSFIGEGGRLNGSPATNERAGAGSLAFDEQSLTVSNFASGGLLNRQKNYLRGWLAERLNRIVPYFLLVWLLGVFVLFARFLGGWIWTQQLKRRVDLTLTERPPTLDSLARRIRVSALVEAPIMIGWLHPLSFFRRRI